MNTVVVQPNMARMTAVRAAKPARTKLHWWNDKWYSNNFRFWKPQHNPLAQVDYNYDLLHFIEMQKDVM